MNITNNTFSFRNILKLYFGPPPCNYKYRGINRIPNLCTFGMSLKDPFSCTNLIKVDK